MMSHKLAEAQNTSRSSGETGPRSPENAAPVQLPPSSAETSETLVPKDQEIQASSRLESELKGVKHNIATVDEELARFDTRLSGTTTDDQRMSLKEKRKVFEQRRKVLVDREAFILRKIDSLTCAVEVHQRPD